MQNSKAIEETNQFKYVTIKHLDKGKKKLSQKTNDNTGKQY